MLRRLLQWLDRRQGAKACERCGCTDRYACPGGCGWDSLYRSEGRFICTSCVAGGDA